MDDYGQSSGLSNFAFHELGRGAALAEQSTARVMVSVRNRLRGGGQGALDLLLALQQAQENEAEMAYQAQYWHQNYVTLKAWADVAEAELAGHRAERDSYRTYPGY